MLQLKSILNSLHRVPGLVLQVVRYPNRNAETSDCTPLRPYLPGPCLKTLFGLCKTCLRHGHSLTRSQEEEKIQTPCLDLLCGPTWACLGDGCLSCLVFWLGLVSLYYDFLVWLGLGLSPVCVKVDRQRAVPNDLNDHNWLALQTTVWRILNRHWSVFLFLAFTLIWPPFGLSLDPYLSRVDCKLQATEGPQRSNCG